MGSAQGTGSPTSPQVQLPRTIRYADWQGPIQRATELDQLFLIVNAYLSEWRCDQLAMLPPEAGRSVLSSSAEIALRAVTAAQAELKAHPDDANAELMREMALTMMAAATRLRFLTSMRTRESRGLFG
jgi:hypothetical protein